MTHELINAELKKLVGTQLDFSQYIGLLFRKELEKTKKSIPIGTISFNKEMNGVVSKSKARARFAELEFTMSICGLPNTTSYTGDPVNIPTEYAQYFKDKRECELNHDTMSYVEVLGEIEGKKYQGVFFSIGDALAHMEKIEKGELIAEDELVTA